MSQEIYFYLVNVRKYLKMDRMTAESKIMSIINRNVLLVERHMKLLKNL